MYKQVNRCSRSKTVGVAILGIAAAMMMTPDRRAAGLPGGGAPPNFMGAAPGIPIDFEIVPLPPVVVGPHNDPPTLADQPFVPSFARLVEGEIVITTESQMRHVWRRLFDAPFDASLFDFNSSFVVLMGNGLQHPAFGFQITNVEQFEATFEAHGAYLEYGLAIVGTTVLPGPPPPKKDSIYKLSAVRIASEYSGDVLFSRQVLAAP